MNNLQLKTNNGEEIVQDQDNNSLEGTDGPSLKIITEPDSLHHFRFKSELQGTHGTILGQSAPTNSKEKRYPEVELKNYKPGQPDENVIVRCSICTVPNKKLTDRVPHVHFLVKKVVGNNKFTGGTRNEPHDIQICGPVYKAVFKDMILLKTKKSERVEVLIEKEKEHKRREFVKATKSHLYDQDDEDKMRKQAEERLQNMDMHVVCLKFEALVEDTHTGKYKPLCSPVYSEPIKNKKSPKTNKLSIVKVMKVSGSCEGGEEVCILVDQVNKDDIKVKFYEENEDGIVIWSDYACITLVHHQYAITFNTPPYRDTNITGIVKVYIQLERENDQAKSEPKEFCFTPKNHRIRREQSVPKRKVSLTSTNVQKINQYQQTADLNSPPQAKHQRTQFGSSCSAAVNSNGFFFDQYETPFYSVQKLSSSFNSYPSVGTINSQNSIPPSQASVETNAFTNPIFQETDPMYQKSVESVNSFFPHEIANSKMSATSQLTQNQNLKHQRQNFSEQSANQLSYQLGKAVLNTSCKIYKSTNSVLKQGSQIYQTSTLQKSHQVPVVSSSTACEADLLPQFSTNYYTSNQGLTSPQQVVPCQQVDNVLMYLPFSPDNSSSSSATTSVLNNVFSPANDRDSLMDLHLTPSQDFSLEDIEPSITILSEGLPINQDNPDINLYKGDCYNFDSHMDLCLDGIPQAEQLPEQESSVSSSNKTEDLNDKTQEDNSAESGKIIENIVTENEKKLDSYLSAFQEDTLSLSSLQWCLELLFSQSYGEDDDTVLHMLASMDTVHVLPKAMKFFDVLNAFGITEYIINIKNLYLETPLIAAAARGTAEMVSLFLDSGADINEVDLRQNTAMHYACQRLDLGEDIMAALLKHQPSLDITNEDGFNVLHLAASLKRLELIYRLTQESRILFKHTNLVNLPDSKEGNTALHIAVQSRNIEIVNFLLQEEKIDVNAANFGGRTPLSLVFEEYDVKSVKIRDLLLSHGGNPNLVLCESSEEEEDQDEEETEDEEESKNYCSHIIESENKEEQEKEVLYTEILQRGLSAMTLK